MAQTPPCAMEGASSVFIGGKPALRLSDVQGCPNVRYEILPSILIEGQPAVRLLPNEDCAPAGDPSVLAEGGAIATRGDCAGSQ